jgi:hypothetical protein
LGKASLRYVRKIIIKSFMNIALGADPKRKIRANLLNKLDRFWLMEECLLLWNGLAYKIKVNLMLKGV